MLTNVYYTSPSWAILLGAFTAMFNQRCDVTVPFPYTHARTTDTHACKDVRHNEASNKMAVSSERHDAISLIYIYNWIECGVFSIIVWFADNVPPSLCSTSACAVQFNCFLPTARACYVTFARQYNETMYMRLCNGGTSMQRACGISKKTT